MEMCVFLLPAQTYIIVSSIITRLKTMNYFNEKVSLSLNFLFPRYFDFKFIPFDYVRLLGLLCNGVLCLFFIGVIGVWPMLLCWNFLMLECSQEVLICYVPWVYLMYCTAINMCNSDLRRRLSMCAWEWIKKILFWRY